MKSLIKILFLGVFTLMLSSQSFAAQDVIRVGINNSVAPFCYVKDGEATGFERDMWDAIGEKINAKIEYVPAGLSTLFGYLDNDDIDFIASYVAINKKRQERYNFTDPYGHGYMKLLVKKSNNDLPNGLSDCDGKNIAVTATSNGRMLIEEINKAKNMNIKIMVLESDEGCVQAVEMGQAVGYFTGAGTSVRFIQEGYIDGKFVGPSEQITDTAYVYNKNNPRVEAYAQKVNKALKEFKESGFTKEVSIKWAGIDITDASISDSF